LGADVARIRHPAFLIVGVWIVIAIVAVVASGDGNGVRCRKLATSAHSAYGQNDAATPPDETFGRLAGYVRVGSMSEVGATWTVPGIVVGSRPGRAATWIGAQAPGAIGPFIQVGINEECEPDSSGHGVDYYYAFWSDTAHHFHPEFLFGVQPEDTIAATLDHRAGRWQVSIKDAAAGHQAAFVTRDEASARFDLAEWLQEDITQVKNNQPFPYPHLRTVTIRDLRVDSVAPSYASVESQWMSENHQNLGPSPLRDGRFSLRPVAISTAGARYLDLAHAGNEAEAVFTTQSAGWSRGVAASAVRSERAAFAAALARTITGLRAGSWPSGVQPLVDQLVDADRRLRAATEVAPTLDQSGLSAWQTRWGNAAQALSSAGHQLRRALGIPQFT
jgi:hypothetical protein